MRNILTLIGICFFISCNNEVRNEKSDLDHTDTAISASIDSGMIYDSAFVLNTLGKEKFYAVRNQYKNSLISLLNNLVISNDTAILDKQVANARFMESLVSSIPISPTEFKIYDSLFFDKHYANRINELERLVLQVLTDKKQYFKLKESLMVSYTNMYTYMYSGIFLDEARIEDAYYFYDINSIICNNDKLFCDTVWQQLTVLSQKQDNLIDLYNCRCGKKVLDELDFCN